MQKPFLIVVTGQPGAGKTTLAHALGGAAYLPVVSRDGIKEGFVHTLRRDGTPLPDNANHLATEIFFDILMRYIDRGISVIAEAAFQHRLWAEYLQPFWEKASVRVCICLPGTDETAQTRYLSRGLENPAREMFHGDFGVRLAREGVTPVFTPYDPPRLNAPTFRIDTTGAYDPPLEALIPLLLGEDGFRQKEAL